jgi:hypothetical protein
MCSVQLHHKTSSYSCTLQCTVVVSMGTRRSLTPGCHWRAGGWCMPALYRSPMPLWCYGLARPWGLRMVAAACFLEVYVRSGCPQSGASRIRGMSLFVRWSGGSWCWLLFGKWSRVGNGCRRWLMCLLGRGLLRSRPSPKLPPPSGLPCIFCQA